ncbi:hypothetical protein VLK81_09665 [Citroniella saccharovorans]|uniref:Uncharacterized protein n=1 Tax=Citroniella saccharovorans TaxID=2053367 RepID=A0AAW9MWF9_9FIRM|nr:hypothetical protein [Citroniella saccharovorans]MEB3428863.1 hypothetical protein [Citroniella saccharovorans]MEB3428910.1 hypothetical protein [Citroniella saccharovorans]MEB3430250.1 hypothetical protein [Citroniella saccharovorans]
MEIYIKFADGTERIIKIDCDKKDIIYDQEDNGITKIYVKDELVHIFNLNEICHMQFK